MQFRYLNSSFACPGIHTLDLFVLGTSKDMVGIPLNTSNPLGM